MNNFEWIKGMEPYEMAQFLSRMQGDTSMKNVDKNESWLNKEIALTWDDIFWRAYDKGFGNDDLTAKDEARYQLTQLIQEELGFNIDDCECPEDEIDFFLEDRKDPVYFDDRGNIIKS